MNALGLRLGALLVASALTPCAALGAPPPSTAGTTPPGSGLGATLWLYAAIVLVIAGLLLAAITLVAIMRRKRIEAASLPPLEPRADEPRHDHRHAAPSEMAASSAQIAEAQRLFNLMGEAEELAGRLGHQLNEQADRLQRLIKRAEDRIERLEQLSADSLPRPVHTIPPEPHAYRPSTPQAPTPAPLPAPPPPAPRAPAPSRPLAPPPAPIVPVPPPRAPAPVVTRPVRTPMPAVAAPVGAAGSQRSAPAGRRPEPATPTALDPLTAEVYRLADEGLAVVDIAKHLGQHTGKVELILALRQA